MQVQRSIMRNRESPSNDCRIRKITISAAVWLLLLGAAAAAFFEFSGWGTLTLTNGRTGEVFAKYRMKTGDTFGIRFIHSVNKSPLTDYYELRRDGIYVEKTV